MRLNQYIASCGLCSRREADKLIDAGKVSVNDVTASFGMKIEEGDLVKVDGKEIKQKSEHIVLAYYKPRGIVCTEKDSHAEKTVIEDVNYSERVTYAGRLDKDSEGLLILTNDGNLINAMMKGSNKHEKEYVVKVNKSFDDKFIEKMSKGVYLKELDRTTRPCKVKKLSNDSFNIILTQGLNRQIRRMCDELGFKVVSLKRVRVMTVKLSDYDLKPSSYHKLDEGEVLKLYKAAGIQL